MTLQANRLALGLTYTWQYVFMLATLTIPSLLVLTSNILAKGPVEQETPVSTMRNRSPTWKFLFLKFHFFHLVNKGAYFFNHLCQNISVAASTALYLFLWLMSSRLVTDGSWTGSIEQEMIWCNWLKIVNIITSRCNWTTIDNTFNFCMKSQ